MKQKILIPVVWSISIITGQAQHVVNATGATLSNSNLVVEYSIGEIVTATIQNSISTATQGLLQPTYDIVSDVNEGFDSNFSFGVYPNPVAEQLNIKTDYTEFRIVLVYDAVGRMIGEYKFDGKPIGLSSLSPGTYMILFQSNKYTKSIKIIKQ